MRVQGFIGRSGAGGRPERRGYALVLVLVVTVLILSVASALLSTRSQAQAQAVRLARQGEADALLQGNAEQMRALTRERLRLQGYFVPATLTTGVYFAESADVRTSVESIAASASSIPLTVGQGTPMTRLENPFDPYNGAWLRRNDWISVRQVALRRDAVPSGPARGRWQESVIGVRQFPASTYSTFSAGDMTLSPNSVPGGRVHANGSLTIAGGRHLTTEAATVSGDIRFIGGGQLAVSNAVLGRTAVLATNVILDPGDPAASVRWAAARQAQFRNQILTLQDAPVEVLLATNLAGLTRVGGALALACDYTLLVTNLTQALPQGFSFYTSAGQTSGPVVRLNYKEVRNEAWRSLRVQSTLPGFALLVDNASNLGKDFSIVTPHRLYLKGSFNSQGGGLFAASLITGDRVHVVPNSW